MGKLEFESISFTPNMFCELFFCFIPLLFHIDLSIQRKGLYQIESWAIEVVLGGFFSPMRLEWKVT